METHALAEGGAVGRQRQNVGTVDEHESVPEYGRAGSNPASGV